MYIHRYRIMSHYKDNVCQHICSMCVQFSKCTVHMKEVQAHEQKSSQKNENWPDSSEDLLQYLTVHFQIQAVQQRIANMNDSMKIEVIVIILIHSAHGSRDVTLQAVLPSQAIYRSIFEGNHAFKETENYGVKKVAYIGLTGASIRRSFAETSLLYYLILQ